MRTYFRSMEFKYFESTLLIHFNAAQLRREPDRLQAFIDELSDELGRWLPIHLRGGPTHAELRSMRIKRGIKAAKERRQKKEL